MSDDEKEKQLVLIYLFLSSENRISDADYALFEEVGKSIEGFSEMKGKMVGLCETILAMPNTRIGLIHAKV